MDPAFASPIPPSRKPALHPARPLDPWKATITRWLAEDEETPKERRHTARRVFQRLVEELGTEVGESTIRRYVACELTSRVDEPKEQRGLKVGQRSRRLGGRERVGRFARTTAWDLVKSFVQRCWPVLLAVVFFPAAVSLPPSCWSTVGRGRSFSVRSRSLGRGV